MKRTIRWLKSRVCRGGAALVVLSSAMGCMQDRHAIKQNSGLQPIKLHSTADEANGSPNSPANNTPGNSAVVNPGASPGQAAVNGSGPMTPARLPEWNQRADPRSPGNTPISSPGMPGNLSGAPTSFNGPSAPKSSSIPAMGVNQSNYQSSAAWGGTSQQVHTIVPDQVNTAKRDSSSVPAPSLSIPSSTNAAAASSPNLDTPGPSLTPAAATKGGLPPMDPIPDEAKPAGGPKVLYDSTKPSQRTSTSTPAPVLLPEPEPGSSSKVPPAPISLPTLDGVSLPRN
jgi:hypothetical protein